MFLTRPQFSHQPATTFRFGTSIEAVQFTGHCGKGMIRVIETRQQGFIVSLGREEVGELIAGWSESSEGESFVLYSLASDCEWAEIIIKLQRMIRRSRRGVHVLSGPERTRTTTHAAATVRAAKCQQGKAILLQQLSISLCGFILYCRMWGHKQRRRLLSLHNINQDDDRGSDNKSYYVWYVGWMDLVVDRIVGSNRHPPQWKNKGCAIYSVH